MIHLVVNGQSRAVAAPPRTHLADVLREEMWLTGTHIGCEHGVCGACTVLVEDEPARACLTFPALCDGARVQTIEGLDEDAIIVALRAAFKAEHALQCGFCTPGMLVTARDIVRRWPGADEARIRLELSGNLCRCTGYQGIVRAIQRVLADPAAAAPPVAAPVAALAPMPAAAPSPQPRAVAPAGRALTLRQAFALSPDALWTALQDPALLVSCVPGAVLTSHDGEALSGELTAGLGPIRTRFVGEGRLSYDAATRTGALEGQGQDRLSSTRASGSLRFRVEASATGSTLDIEVEYSLRGPLAQMARPGIVGAFVEELIASFSRRLETALGVTSAVAPAPQGWRAAWRWIARRLFARHD